MIWIRQLTGFLWLSRVIMFVKTQATQALAQNDFSVKIVVEKRIQV